MGEFVKKKLYYLDKEDKPESNLITTFIKHLYSPSLIGITTDNM